VADLLRVLAGTQGQDIVPAALRDELRAIAAVPVEIQNDGVDSGSAQIGKMGDAVAREVRCAFWKRHRRPRGLL
jgi:hypothetical protein